MIKLVTSVTRFRLSLVIITKEASLLLANAGYLLFDRTELSLQDSECHYTLTISNQTYWLILLDKLDEPCVFDCVGKPYGKTNYSHH